MQDADLNATQTQRKNNTDNLDSAVLTGKGIEVAFEAAVRMRNRQ